MGNTGSGPPGRRGDTEAALRCPLFPPSNEGVPRGSPQLGGVALGSAVGGGIPAMRRNVRSTADPQRRGIPPPTPKLQPGWDKGAPPQPAGAGGAAGRTPALRDWIGSEPPRPAQRGPLAVGRPYRGPL